LNGSCGIVTFMSIRMQEPPFLPWRTPGTLYAAKDAGSLMFQRAPAGESNPGDTSGNPRSIFK